MRDVIVKARANLYLCGHQHLMAHFERKPEQRSRPRGGGTGDGSMHYVIVGSSSKLEQDIEDFEEQSSAQGNELGSRTESNSRWKEQELQRTRNKMSAMWHREDVGFALVRVTAQTLVVQYFVVEARTEGDVHSRLVHEVVQRADEIGVPTQ